jgi:hypothetical protein
MDPWLVTLIVGSVISGIIGLIGWFGKNSFNDAIKKFDNISEKIDKIIDNQNDQKITIAEMKKDIEVTIDNYKRNRTAMDGLIEKVHDLLVFKAEILEWKNNKHNKENENN